MTFRRYLVLAVVAITAPLGDFLLSVGMKRSGPVSLEHLSSLIAAVRTPYVIFGIALLICFFASYLASLSWADLTYVLPATSVSNILTALLAHFCLHENISPSRWLGILLITLAVGFVAQGPSYTEIEKTAADITPKATQP